MKEEITVEEFESLESAPKYLPERDYKSSGYKPYNKCMPDMCNNCDLYYQKLYDNRLVLSPKTPACRRHVLDELRAITEADFENKEEYEDLIINADPVSWAYKHFGWEARWYQEEMMSCTANKKVVRAGRRTGKTTCIVVLVAWMLYTNQDFTILVVAPYQAQVTKIFDELTKLLSSNEHLWGSIKRNTKNPHRLELNNGSKALGFSSGPQSSARSDKIRGQDANFIVLDEADYLADDDLEAILAILASHPDCGLWGSSTPTGKHQKYYTWAVQKALGFKEFHYISQESPSWTQEVEEFYKNSYDRVAYEHEFLAEFGIQEKGVFRNDLVDESLRDYSMPREPNPKSRVLLGVDWNGPDVGVHICAVEYDGKTYTLLEKSVVKAGDFTQHEAIDRILELDKRYNSDFIYVDAGYGAVQVEMLHKMGIANPSTRLHKKVVAYDFSSKVEIRDPKTGTMIKKAPKPFMVNMTTIQLEEDRLILPRSEDTQVLVDTTEGEESGLSSGLVQQMRNFEILRYSVTGLPTYSQGEDHTLIAYMLCIVGFLLEFSDLRSYRTHMGMMYTGPLGEGGPSQRDPQRVEENLSAVARQLDAGTNQYAIKPGMAGVLGIRDNTSKLRNSIAKGDKKTTRRYFGASNINRGGSLGNDRRRF
jgi:hypothetical protein